MTAPIPGAMIDLICNELQTQCLLGMVCFVGTS